MKKGGCHHSPQVCYCEEQCDEAISEIAALHCVPLAMTLLCAAQRLGFMGFLKACETYIFTWPAVHCLTICEIARNACDDPSDSMLTG